MYKIEYARSDHTDCSDCDKKILKDSVKIAFEIIVS
jgi:hypothetical protein